MKKYLFMFLTAAFLMTGCSKNEVSKMNIDDIINSGYKIEYAEECNYIWKNYVPENGASDCLQGELLREIEKLRYEAQDNGNVNWDEDFEYFCEFIPSSIEKYDIFSKEEKETLRTILDYIKEHGEYASVCYNEDYSDEDVEKLTGKEFDPLNIAYVNDDIYDIVADKIGKLQKEFPDPIPYTHSKKIIR